MRKRGFTLIELLVVIAIIAILAAILFPVITNAKEKGRQVKCSSNLKQLIFALRQYCDDNNGYMPFCWTGTTEPCDWAGCSSPSTWDTSKGAIFSYIRNTDVFKCPTNAAMKKNNTSTYSMPNTFNSLYSNSSSMRRYKLETLTGGFSSRKALLVEEKQNNDSYFVVLDFDSDPFTVCHLEGGNLAFADGHVAYKTKVWVDSQRRSVNTDKMSCFYAFK